MMNLGDLEAPGHEEGEEAAPAPPSPSPPDPKKALADKIRRYRGETYPLPDATDGEKIQFIREKMRQTEADAQARFRQATQNLLYMSGRQYLTWSSRTKMWDELPLLGEQEHRVTMNYIKPILRSRTQRMLSGPIQYAARPSSNAFEARDRAHLGATLIQSRHEATHIPAKLDQAMELAYAAGVAFLKSFWNRDIGPQTPATMQAVDVGPDGAPQIVEQYIDEHQQPVADKSEAFYYRPGDTDTAVRSVFNVRINPDAMAFDPGAGLRWLLDTDILPLDEAREMFPDFAERIQSSIGEDAVALTLERLAAGAAIAGALRPSAAPNKQSHPTTIIQEYWELQSECFPRGRLMVRVSDVIVYDGPFPDGVLPYVPVYDEPAPLTPMGRPSVNDMRSPQDTINRQWVAIDAEMRQSGIGRYVAWDHPNIPDQIVADDRTVIKIPMTRALTQKSLGELFHRLDPGAVGADRWRIIQEAKSALYDIGGFHEVSRGQVPPGVDSGVAIEQLREEESGQLAKSRTALKQTLIDHGRVQLAIAVNRYGADFMRYLPQDREDLGYILQGVTGAELPNPDDITIELEGFKAMSPAAQRAEIKEAHQSGLIDARKTLQLLDLGKGLAPALDSQTRHYHRARTINVALERGEYMVQSVPVSDPDDPMAEPMVVEDLMYANGDPFVLPHDDDHLIHLAVLDELALDDSKPQPVREAARKLKAQRRRTIDLLTADAAPPQAPPQ